MTTKTDGGEAFPVVHPDGMGVQYFGLSVRDYFAAQVIGPAFLDLFTGWRQAGEPVQEDWPMGLAIDAYRVADAMIRVRTQDASHE